MHTHDLGLWTHDHTFLGAGHERNERRTRLVVGLTAAMMVAEIVGGTIFHSMALVADGWHMSTHALALGISALAYRFARTHARDPRFAFGTGKLGELAAFGSAIILAMIALYIGIESIQRLISPVQIAFGEAIPIAALGLGVNLASVALLHGDEDHHGHGHHGHGDHGRGHSDHAHHDHDDHHHEAHDRAHAADHHHGHAHDTNLRAAYIHVLADALTSVLAIIALTCGKLFGLNWLDPLMGLVGTFVIATWSVNLVRTSGETLLDVVPSAALATRIRAAAEVGEDRVADLHLWRLGPGHVGLILAIVTHEPQAPDVYKRRLAGITGLSHVTIEVHPCREAA